jgi:hypothetical protein
MKLTGKCKEDFEKWLEEKYEDIKVSMSHQLMFSPYHHFHLLPQSMQYGVYVDFFDSVGGVLIHSIKPLRSGEWECLVNGRAVIGETRQEARVKAIEKANEIYNESK